MKKPILLLMLAALILAPLSLQAHERGYDKHWKSQHHSYRYDHGGHDKHGKYGKHKRYVKHYYHSPRHAHSDYHRPYRRHDDGGHWGIVFRYFD